MGKISYDFILIDPNSCKREKKYRLFYSHPTDIYMYEKNKGCFFSRKSQYQQHEKNSGNLFHVRNNLVVHEKKHLKTNK